MAGVNKVIIVGFVGKDPEIRKAGESNVSSFSLAVSESWKTKQGEKQEYTEWFNVEAWGTLADIVGRYVKKGIRLYVEGKFKTDTFEKDGIKQYRSKVVASVITMLGDGKHESNPVKTEYPNNDVDSDDLPF